MPSVATEPDPSAHSRPLPDSVGGVLSPLSLTGVSKRFGGVVAVEDFSMRLEPGASLGLIGPNGAGKSTVLRLIAGVHRPDQGRIELGERRLDRLPGYQVPRLGVALAHQIPRPFGRLTVRQNVLIGARTGTSRASWLGGRGQLSRARERVEAIVELTGLASKSERLAGELGLLDRKRLELARALSLDPQILMLDEVAAGLVGAEVDEIIALVNRIRVGRSLIVVEHVEAVVAQVVERVMVLDWGKVLTEGTPEEVRRDARVIEVYFGRGSEGDRPAAPRKARRDTKGGGRALNLSGVSVDYGQLRALRDVDLHIDDGEIVAVLGANGAGKTTLARAISGLNRVHAGRVEIAGRDVTALGPHRRVELGLAHCQEGRRIFSNLSVRENLELGAYAEHARAHVEDNLARVYRIFPVLEEFADRPGDALSGGQQQMLAIARALMSSPKLVIFDEISIGLAPEAIDRVYAAIRPINEMGVGILLVEQNVYRGLEVANRVYVLDRGTVSFSGTPAELQDEERLSLAYFGPSKAEPRSGATAEAVTDGGTA